MWLLSAWICSSTILMFRCYAIHRIFFGVTQRSPGDNKGVSVEDGFIMRFLSKALVVSLPRDAAIWKAFVKNEKVQELMQSDNRNLPQLEGDNGEAFRIDYQQEEVNPFLVMIHCVQSVVWEIMGTMVDIMNSIFGFELFGEKDCDLFDKMFKTCMVLTILVLALVVVKRGLVVT
ncbi:unnamed protein product [Sphagnum jensenii]|uniref:Uncharacterized protein n=1 Tax=Sphagnum jensenii TaxID=128206 RepID=A0ABP0WXY8_9BRYO